MATILDVNAGQWFSFAEFVRARQADILEDWHAAITTAGPQIDSARAATARELLDSIVAEGRSGASDRERPPILDDSRTAIVALRHTLSDLFVLGGAIVRRVQIERGGLSASELEWLWSAIERASQGAVAAVSARILKSDAGRQATEDRQRFLDEATRLLAETLDYESTLKTVARLAIPAIADWCIIDVLRRDGTLARVATEHKNPASAGLAAELHRNPPEESANCGAPQVVRSGSTDYVPRMSDELLEQREQDPRRLQILRRLQLSSMICAPLRTRDRLIGTITLFTEGARELIMDDVRMAEDLAQRAAVAIENARLFEEAQRAVHAREEILAMVTHDLRTPLSAIVTAASLLSSDPSSQDAERNRQRTEAIQRAAAHMSRLVRDLTDLAQVDAGRLAIEKKDEDPAALIRQAVETLEPVVQSRGGTLECAIDNNLIRVACDRDRIVQVLSNLVANASKVGAQRITVGVKESAEEIDFWVSDDGPGIPPEDLPHMFDRYFRGRHARYKGSGLGLPIANGIVQAHGGRMWIESTVGVGSTFYFAVPR